MTWETKRDAFLAAMQARPQVMGILNVTPDSFSDGGQHNAITDAVKHADQMVSEGCDIIDVGGESTRPGSDKVGVDAERARAMPVVETLGQLQTPVSIDTYKATIASEAVAAGAVMINDVWGGQADPDMPTVMAETEALVCLMHNRETTDAAVNIMDDLRRFLDRSLDLVRRAGVAESRILLDPGIGFGKTPEQSLTCISRLGDLSDWYGLPVLLGLSRKRFIGHVLDTEVDKRLTGTLAANMSGLARGAKVIRVHDVAPHSEAVRMFAAIERAST